MNQTIENQPAEKTATPAAPRLLDHLSDTARLKGHSDEVAKEMADWCRRFVLFHGKRHPRELGRGEGVRNGPGERALRGVRSAGRSRHLPRRPW